MEHRENPFPCRVVRHRGARRMTLRVGPGGARLTVPPRTPARRIDAFLRESEGWAREALARRPAAADPADGASLALLDDSLTLALRPAGPGRRAGARREGDVLAVGVRAGEAVLPYVEAWYRREARAVIAPRAEAAAALLGRSVARVAIRDPRSRWGSCSSNGTLSFSWRLLLAPEEVLDSVVAHEACHLVRPDHSPAFWALLDELHPGHRDAREWLRLHAEDLHGGPDWRSRATA